MSCAHLAVRAQGGTVWERTKAGIDIRVYTGCDWGIEYCIGGSVTMHHFVGNDVKAQLTAEWLVRMLNDAYHKGAQDMYRSITKELEKLKP